MQGVYVVVIPVKPLRTTDQLDPAKDQVERPGKLRVGRVGMGVEGPARRRIALDDHEVAVMVLLGPAPQCAFVCRRQVGLVGRCAGDLERLDENAAPKLTRHMRNIDSEHVDCCAGPGMDRLDHPCHHVAQGGDDLVVVSDEPELDIK